MSLAEEAFRFSQLFEAELLLELMLRYWRHPLRDDREFRENLIEATAEILRSAAGGQQIVSEVSADKINFVMAVCLVERSSLELDPGISTDEREARFAWVEEVRRAIPSCFCDPDDLT